MDLFPLPGHDKSLALGLNDSALVVGSSNLVANPADEAAVSWTVDEAGNTLVATLPGIAGERSIQGAEVNNNGVVAGEGWVTENGVRNVHAVIWIGTFGAHIPHDLGTLGGSFVSSSATSVSEPDANGHVWIVGDSRTEATPLEPMIRRGVLWQVDSQGSVLSTTDLNPTGSSVWARDVRVIGNSVFIAGATGDQAMIWEADLSGNVVGSQELGSASFEAMEANALNDDGDVVGRGREPGGIRNAYLYEAGVFTDLGSLGNSGSWAWGVNDNDIVVGAYQNVKTKGFQTIERHAFVWANGTMDKLLEQVSDNTFSSMYSAFDVNSAGEIIGHGSVGKMADAQEHGFLVIPQDDGGGGDPGGGKGGGKGGPRSLLAQGHDGGSAPILTQGVAEAVVAQVISLWSNSVGVNLLNSVEVVVADLPAGQLGEAYGNRVTLDVNGNGAGWSVAGADSHYDLLTVAAHEIGHLLGYDHSHDEADLMASHLPVGIRRLPNVFPLNEVDIRIMDMAFLPSQAGGVLQSLWEDSDVKLDSLNEDLVFVRRQGRAATLALDLSRTVPTSRPNDFAAVDRDEDDFEVGRGVLDDALLELLADDLASIDE